MYELLQTGLTEKWFSERGRENSCQKIIFNKVAGVNPPLTSYTTGIFQRLLYSFFRTNLFGYIWLFILVFYITNPVSISGEESFQKFFRGSWEFVAQLFMERKLTGILQARHTSKRMYISLIFSKETRWLTIFGDDSKWLKPVTHLRWSVFQKQVMPCSHQMFS